MHSKRIAFEFRKWKQKERKEIERAVNISLGLQSIILQVDSLIQSLEIRNYIYNSK